MPRLVDIQTHLRVGGPADIAAGLTEQIVCGSFWIKSRPPILRQKNSSSHRSGVGTAIALLHVPELFADERLHPDDLGHMIYGANLSAGIYQILMEAAAV